MTNDHCRSSSSRSDRRRECRNANDVIGATGASSRSVQRGAEREAPQQKRPTLGKAVGKPLPSWKGLSLGQKPLKRHEVPVWVVERCRNCSSEVLVLCRL